MSPLVSGFMCEAAETASWHLLDPTEFQDCSKISYLECASEQEEVLVAILKAAEVLAKSDSARVAIINNNPAFSKRVLMLAKAFSLDISHNQKRSSKEENFIQIFNEAKENNFAPHHLLAVLKHELFPNKNVDLVYRLEKKYLRGICLYSSLSELINSIDAEDKDIIALLQSLNNISLGNDTFIEDESQGNIMLINSSDAAAIDFDCVIIPDMNEGSWPSNDTGQTQQNLFYLLHNKEVLLTRACYKDGMVQIASRYVMRLKVFAQKINKLKEITESHNYLLIKARGHNIPTEFKKYIPANPSPEIRFRPEALSVTQIEKLLQDPYAIYVSKILKLKPLEPLNKEPSQLEFGNFAHELLDWFSRQYQNIKPENHFKEFLAQGYKLLANIVNRPVVRHIWIQRLINIAQWSIEFEKERRAHNKIVVYSEVKGVMNFGSLALTARADRIETSNDAVSIIDFKTGTLPTIISINNNTSLQTSIAALMLQNNSFPAIKSAQHNITELSYISLAAGKKFGQSSTVTKEIDAIISGAHNVVLEIIDTYYNKLAPYSICPDPHNIPKYNDYKHLERLDEWQK